MRSLKYLKVATMFAACTAAVCGFTQTPAPKLVEHNGRYALMVDGSPFLVLGAQINNSSSWPDILPEVWPALEAAHVNTAEAPVYWEQIEPKPGEFNWTNVDALLDGARAHKLHLILLWFGTWKNGNDHYVPEWVKLDTKRYPRVQNKYGTPLDVLSANEPANMEADRKAFTALMHHLAERDAAEHTVLMMQVENESGNVGSVRDYSADANRQFAEAVPATLTKALGKKPGTWAEVFGGDAEEAFQAWTQARYINAIVEAGKKEFQIPMYCNVWLAYPPSELPERHIPIPGMGYPAGGPVQTMVGLWKTAAPAIDMIGPDIYSANAQVYTDVLRTYARKDNPLWIPETGSGDAFAPFFFAALGKGAIGFSPFGIDWTNWTLHTGDLPKAHARNYALVSEMDRTLAELNYQGKLHSVVEAIDGPEKEMALAGPSEPEPMAPIRLANATVPLDEVGSAETRAEDAKGDWIAEVMFGFPQPDGAPAPGTATKDGRVLIAQLGPDEFLLTGIGGSVRFHRPGLLSGIRMQILSAEEGYYTPGATPGSPDVWHQTRMLNGDQTDRGIQFPEAAPAKELEHPISVRIRLGRF